MPGHRFVHVHCGERRNVETGQPHIHDNGDFQGAVIIFESIRQRFPVVFVPDDPAPFRRIPVALRHHHRGFLCPFGPEFENAAVYLHGGGTGVRHNQRLAGQQVFPVVLIVAENVAHQRVDGFVIAEDRLHFTERMLAFPHDLRLGMLRHPVVFLVDELQRGLVQLQLHDAAFIINRSGGAVLDRLRHIVNVYVVAEHLAGVAVFG